MAPKVKRSAYIRIVFTKKLLKECGLKSFAEFKRAVRRRGYTSITAFLDDAIDALIKKLEAKKRRL
jgi:hypothetical protein